MSPGRVHPEQWNTSNLVLKHPLCSQCVNGIRKVYFKRILGSSNTTPVINQKEHKHNVQLERTKPKPECCNTAPRQGPGKWERQAKPHFHCSGMTPEAGVVPTEEKSSRLAPTCIAAVILRAWHGALPRAGVWRRADA